jgi:hypothetical protein
MDEEVSFEPEPVTHARLLLTSDRQRFRLSIDPVGWLQKPAAPTDGRLRSLRGEFEKYLVAKQAKRWDGPLEVSFVVRVPRRSSNAHRLVPVGAPSALAFQAALLKSCTGILWVNPEQIVTVTTRKDWADVPVEIGIEIEVRQICTKDENERKAVSHAKKG